MATVDKNAKALLETARIKGLQQLCIKRRENELKMHPKTKISYKSLKAVIDNMQKAKRKVKKPLDIKLFCTNNSKEQFQYGTINAVYVGIRQSILKRNWKALAYLLKVGLHSKNPKHRQHLLKVKAL